MATLWKKPFQFLLFSALFFNVISHDANSLSEDLEKLINETAEEIVNKIISEQNRQIDSIKVTDCVINNILMKYKEAQDELKKEKENLTKTLDNLLRERERVILNRVDINITQKVNDTLFEITKAESNIRNDFESKQQNAKNHARLTADRTLQALDIELKNVLKNLSSHSFENEPMEPVAFTALLTTNVRHDNGNYVPFDRVVSNFGNGYDSNTGIFTSTTNGTFMFSTSFLVDDGYVNIQLVKNGNEVGRGYAARDEREGAGFISLIFPVSKGDMIAIRMITGWSTGCIRGDLYSSFSGFLLGVS